MTTPGSTPAGWYPDPNGGPGQMYWDGTNWRTDAVVPVPAQAHQMPMETALGFGPQYPPGLPHGGYGVDAHGRPVSDKSKLAAGLLQIFLSMFAAGRFYLGYNNIALMQIAVTICTCGIGAWWPVIDGILILMGRVPDPQGRALRE